MSVIHAVRRLLSGACFALSSVWGVAGACKLLFGVRITAPLLPPLGLERVAVGPALATAVAFLLLGAWLGRTSAAAEAPELALRPAVDPAGLPAGTPAWQTASVGAASPIPRRQPSA